MVITISNGVLKANDPNTLSEFDGHITSTEDWTGGILQSMVWVTRKGITGRIEPSPQLLAEERFIFQKSIVTVVYDYDIRSDLIIDLAETPLFCVSLGKYTFNLKGGGGKRSNKGCR